MDLTAWFDPDALGTVVPPELARYRRAVGEGFSVFMLRLSPARLARIQAAQAALPDGTPIEARLVALARESPVLHKLAQLLARDRRLPSTLRQLLQGLETMPASVGLAPLRAWIEAELGPLERQGLSLDGPPLAEASVAIVTPFVDAEGRQGVFKVLKPGIEAALAEDLVALQATGSWLDQRCHELGLPEIPYATTFADVARLLRREVLLDQEQHNLGAAGAAYANALDVVVPRLHPASTARLTAMDRIFGRKVTDLGAGPGADSAPGAGPRTAALARRIGDALVARPLWSARTRAPFHADPHAGNLMVTTDGQLAILDWALAGELGKVERIRLTQILVAALTADGQRITAAIEALSRTQLRRAPLAEHVGRGLDRLAGGDLPGMSWLTELLDGVTLEAGGTFAPDLVLFRKSVLVLEGVMADVDETARLDQVIATHMITQLMVEAGPRWLAHPLTRRFGSHLSNVDLMGLMLSAPLRAWRTWPWR